MDDELPLFIYIISQINLKNALVELNLIENYLQFCPSLDKESKVLTNFRVNLFYNFILNYRVRFSIFIMNGKLRKITWKFRRQFDYFLLKNTYFLNFFFLNKV